jgi:MFS family permease
VQGQWRSAAAERVLLTPAPIPIRWSLSDLKVAGPVAAAVGSTDAAPAFSPLPGQSRVTEEQLRAGGGRGELFEVYAGIASGRMVVVGAPGTGKSGAAVLLVLDALSHREGLDETRRARVPVPVLFTVHGWNPHTQSVRDWLSARLVAEYPLFQHRGGHAEAAALVTAGSIALILDGLDEMDSAARPAALQALSDAPLRMVVLTRDQEMVHASRAAWLAGAAAVQLHNVAGPDGADYLQRARTGPPPDSWNPLLTYLREHPDSILTHTLSTPLVLTLIRDTYRVGDNVGELLDTTRFSTAEIIEQHLIARVLPDAYTVRPGRPPPAYSLKKAHQVLTCIARQMNNNHTRDLAWWRIPRWAPTTPRLLSSMLAAVLLGVLVFALVGKLVDEWLLGAAVGAPWVTWGPPVGLVAWLAGRIAAGLGSGEPQRRARTMDWRAFRSRPVLVFGLVAWLAFALMIWLLAWLTPPSVGFVQGFVAGLVLGLPLGLLAWFVFGLVAGVLGGTSDGNPLDPHESWRQDRMSGLAFGVMFGVIFGLVFGLLGMLVARLPPDPGPVVALVVGLVLGLGFWLVLGLAFWLGFSHTWQATLTWLQLQRSRAVPAVALMPFLKDAQTRGVLRTVGAVYQFRHATLQDQLAGQTTASPTTSSAAGHPA